MSARTLIGTGIALVVAFAVALAVFVLSPDPEPAIEGELGTITGQTAFDQGMIEPGPFDAAYSRNGASLGVLSDRGLGLARKGKQEIFLRSTGSDASRIVDFTWMPGSTSLMVIEGPSTATKLSVIDLQGKVIAATALEPPFSPGDGFGLTVDNSNRRAVAVSATRDPIGGARHLDLVIIDLQSGAVVALTSTADVDESSPMFLDDDHILLTRSSADRLEAAVLEINTGTIIRVSPEGKRAFAVGTVDGGRWSVYQEVAPRGTEAVIAAVELGRTEAVRMGTVVAGASVVAVHPQGAEAVVRAPLGAGESSNRLRAQTLRSPGPGVRVGLGSVTPMVQRAEVPWALSPFRRKSWRSTSS